jgi:hypothetical protein
VTTKVATRPTRIRQVRAVDAACASAQPRTLGPIDLAAADDVLATLPILPGWATGDRGRRHQTRRGASAILTWLGSQPGSGWQERWEASGLDTHRDPFALIAAGVPGDSRSKGADLVAGMIGLLTCQLARPSYDFLLLDGDLACAEPKTLRYRLLHVAAPITHTARRTRLAIGADWPWTDADQRIQQPRRTTPAHRLISRLTHRPATRRNPGPRRAGWCAGVRVGLGVGWPQGVVVGLIVHAVGADVLPGGGVARVASVATRSASPHPAATMRQRWFALVESPY